MAHFPEWIDKTEASIINKFLTRVIRNPVHLILRVYDGEELATGWTRDRKTLQLATAQTEATVFQIASGSAGTKNAAQIGTVTFIHGNGEDVLSDYSWRESRAGSEHLLADITSDPADAPQREAVS